MKDLRDSVAVDVAASRLGRSPHEVRRLIRAGRLYASRRGGRWFVLLSEVRRLERLPQPVGRPFSPQAAWALLGMLAGEEVRQLPAPRRSQLRRHLADGEVKDLAGRLAGRASRQMAFADPSALQRLAADPRAVVTGSVAAERAGARLVDADGDELECYVAADDIRELSAEHGLVPAAEVANVVVHVVGDGLRVPRGPEVAAAPVVGLDLWESGDARSSDEGRRLFAEAVQAFRGR